MLIWPPSRSTPGFSGADPAPTINEAALLVARREKAVIELADIDAAIERVVAGSEQRTRAMNPHELERDELQWTLREISSYALYRRTAPAGVSALPVAELLALCC